MKRVTINVSRLLVFLSCLFYGRSANALDLYGFGSYWELEDADGAWGGGVGLSFPLLTDYLRLDSRVYVFESSDLDEDDELELLPIDLGLQLHLLPQQTFDLYALGGAFWVYADADRIDIDSDVGAYAGGGVEIGTETFRLFGEAIYRFVELENDSDFLGRVDRDIEISGINANIGFKVHF